MRCPKCGAKLLDGTGGKYCPYCGWNEGTPKSWLEKQKELMDEVKGVKAIISVLDEEPSWQRYF